MSRWRHALDDRPLCRYATGTLVTSYICLQCSYGRFHTQHQIVSSCCVKGGHKRQYREKDKQYFCIPTVVTGKGEETKEFRSRSTIRRRRAWLAQLRLKGFNFDSSARRFVCSDYFVNGKHLIFILMLYFSHFMLSKKCKLRFVLSPWRADKQWNTHTSAGLIDGIFE